MKKFKRFLILIILISAALFTVKLIKPESKTALAVDKLISFFINNEATTEHGLNLILINDENVIPKKYEVELTHLSNGEDVATLIYPELQKMFDDARALGYELQVVSGYRSQEEQEEILSNKIEAYINEGYSEAIAKEKALEYVAEPGTSEHQTGLAVDINPDDDNIKLYTWLLNNSYKYGFIKRYPEDKTDITGINNEPWHYRYVGKEHAKEIKENGLCLEEYIDKLNKSK